MMLTSLDMCREISGKGSMRSSHTTLVMRTKWPDARRRDKDRVSRQYGLMEVRSDKGGKGRSEI